MESLLIGGFDMLTLPYWFARGFAHESTADLPGAARLEWRNERMPEARADQTRRTNGNSRKDKIRILQATVALQHWYGGICRIGA